MSSLRPPGTPRDRALARIKVVQIGAGDIGSSGHRNGKLGAFSPRGLHHARLAQNCHEVVAIGCARSHRPDTLGVALRPSHLMLIKTSAGHLTRLASDGERSGNEQAEPRLPRFAHSDSEDVSRSRPLGLAACLGSAFSPRGDVCCWSSSRAGASRTLTETPACPGHQKCPKSTIWAL